MALTLAQLQDYINTNVKKNGRQSITGDVMNYLMLQFVDWVDTYSALPDKGGHALKFLRVNAAGTALEWAAVSSGITVGTTPVTSGTDGRVFFQSGGVVSQDSGFLFDTTAKTLTNYGKGSVNSNTSFGQNALETNTSGYLNSAFGKYALQNQTSGYENNAFGYMALNSITTGYDNTAFGYQAGRFITSGTFNTAIGAYALQLNTSPFGYNTAIGFASMQDSTGQYNTGVGYWSGKGITTGQYNTIIGFTPTTSITTGSGNTIVGSQIGAIGNVSNTAIFSDGSGNIAIRKDSSNYVGIGYSATATLGAKLDILAQGALSTDIALRVRNSANTANIFQINGDGSGGWNQDVKIIQFGSSSARIVTGADSTDARLDNFGLNSCKLRSIFNGNSFGMYNMDFVNIGASGAADSKVMALYTRATTDPTPVVGFVQQYGITDVSNVYLRVQNYNGDKINIKSIGGWGTPTGTLTRTTFDASTVTLAELGERVAALITDLKTGHQLLKA